MNEIARIKNEVRLKQWAEKVAPTVLPKTQLGKAFEYAFKRRAYLGNYFKNGDCAISNNAAENAIRPFTVGRKNWLFSDTRTEQKPALIYTASLRQQRQTDLMFSGILS